MAGSGKRVYGEDCGQVDERPGQDVPCARTLQHGPLELTLYGIPNKLVLK